MTRAYGVRSTYCQTPNDEGLPTEQVTVEATVHEGTPGVDRELVAEVNLCAYWHTDEDGETYLVVDVDHDNSERARAVRVKLTVNDGTVYDHRTLS